MLLAKETLYFVNGAKKIYKNTEKNTFRIIIIIIIKMFNAHFILVTLL